MGTNVFVQRVETFWSKASRGTPLSSRRNLCPDAFELSGWALKQLVDGNCYSSVVMRERDAFKPDQSIETFSPFNRFEWPSVSVKFLNNDGVIARYDYNNRIEGAPSRSGRPPITHELSAGQLFQVKFNSRDSWPTGEWHYRLTVFNILLTEAPSATMFLATTEKFVTDIENLW